MPIITKFYGISIKMYFSDHSPAHFHAIYGEYNGIFEINTLKMIEGDLPKRAIKMIQEWGNQYQEELKEMWNSQNLKKLPSIE